MQSKWGASMGLYAEPEKIGFYLDDGFPMLSLSGMTDVMRMANYFARTTLYQWQTVSKNGGHVTSASGLTLVPDAALGELKKVDRFIVVSETDFKFDDAEVSAWLRLNERQGTAIGS
ncbi:MAG: hypothetical protein RLN85_10880, partial [Pseudomonadales bacterium]